MTERQIKRCDELLEKLQEQRQLLSKHTALSQVKEGKYLNANHQKWLENVKGLRRYYLDYYKEDLDYKEDASGQTYNLNEIENNFSTLVKQGKNYIKEAYQESEKNFRSETSNWIKINNRGKGYCGEISFLFSWLPRLKKEIIEKNNENLDKLYEAYKDGLTYAKPQKMLLSKDEFKLKILQLSLITQDNQFLDDLSLTLRQKILNSYQSEKNSASDFDKKYSLMLRMINQGEGGSAKIPDENMINNDFENYYQETFNRIKNRIISLRTTKDSLTDQSYYLGRDEIDNLAKDFELGKVNYDTDITFKQNLAASTVHLGHQEKDLTHGRLRPHYLSYINKNDFQFNEKISAFSKKASSLSEVQSLQTDKISYNEGHSRTKSTEFGTNLRDAIKLEARKYSKQTRANENTKRYTRFFFRRYSRESYNASRAIKESNSLMDILPHVINYLSNPSNIKRTFATNLYNAISKEVYNEKNKNPSDEKIFGSIDCYDAKTKEVAFENLVNFLEDKYNENVKIKTNQYN